MQYITEEPERNPWRASQQRHVEISILHQPGCSDKRCSTAEQSHLQINSVSEFLVGRGEPKKDGSRCKSSKVGHLTEFAPRMDYVQAG